MSGSIRFDTVQARTLADALQEAADWVRQRDNDYPEWWNVLVEEIGSGGWRVVFYYWL